MTLSAVADLPVRPIAGAWYRAIEPRHASNLLDCSYAQHYSSRFYQGSSAPDPFQILYLAENQVVAQFEVEAVFGSPLKPDGIIANPKCSHFTINAEVRLTKVAELTDAVSWRSLGTSAQELTGDWRGYQERRESSGLKTPLCLAPTQEFGAALYSSALFEGFLTISAKLPYHLVLGVFPGRIAEGNFVRYTYNDSAGEQQIHQILARRA